MHHQAHHRDASLGLVALFSRFKFQSFTFGIDTRRSVPRHENHGTRTLAHRGIHCLVWDKRSKAWVVKSSSPVQQQTAGDGDLRGVSSNPSRCTWQGSRDPGLDPANTHPHAPAPSHTHLHTLLTGLVSERFGPQSAQRSDNRPRRPSLFGGGAPSTAEARRHSTFAPNT